MKPHLRSPPSGGHAWTEGGAASGARSRRDSPRRGSACAPPASPRWRRSGSPLRCSQERRLPLRPRRRSRCSSRPAGRGGNTVPRRGAPGRDRGRIARGADDVEARCHECAGSRPPDAAGGAGNDRFHHLFCCEGFEERSSFMRSRMQRNASTVFSTSSSVCAAVGNHAEENNTRGTTGS